MELLKINKIPFKSKIKINGREVDFICGKYAIDIDGHEQDSEKNAMLVREGFVPIHIGNLSAATTDISFLINP
jgi:very-short-patch-repair endonuclease